jgi:hypothetical protein
MRPKFRVLDLGAHDGFVTNWLGRGMKSIGHDLHIDGVELNPAAVEVANRRKENDGEYKVGLAEDAAKLFMAHSYDAVVAYELIEHVVDMNAFLARCETMCKQEGRVYISTPDGTFGAGQNPHHLRAIRAIELYELIRRRGKVEDMIVGEDGVTVICYQPKKGGFTQPGKPHTDEVAIYCGPGWQRWEPTDIERKGLGGSETAAVRLGEELSEMGYTVTVYGEVKESAYKQVAYRRHESFNPMDDRLAVICSRSPALFDQQINAHKKLLWMHDTDYGPAMTPERIEKVDAIMVLSEWHKAHVEQTYPGIDKLHVTANGVHLPYFEGDEERDLHRAMYTSSPDRGLDIVLELWPQVRRKVPDAELYFCYSDVYNAVADADPGLGAFRKRVLELSQQDGVFNLGSLTQPQLSREMKKSNIWLAPSYNTRYDVPFHETYCIGATEAAIAGCALVLSPWGALPERAEDAAQSAQLPASPEGKIDKKHWADVIVDLMAYPTDNNVSPEAQDRTWKAVARDFRAVIEG